MPESKKVWEYAVFPVEFTDLYWRTENLKESAKSVGGVPESMVRGGTMSGTYLNDKGLQGWELVAVLPAGAVKGIPPHLAQPTPTECGPVKWNVYIGIFKREKP